MALTQKNTASAQGASTASEETEGKAMAEQLQTAFKSLRELDAKLIDLRKPVKQAEAAIKGVYDVLEKQGIDRELVAFLYKQKRKNRFTPEKLITMNAYSKALGEPGLPLFEVARVNH